LLLKPTSFELVDINGETCASLETDTSENPYISLIGNPHNDEYFFTALKSTGVLDTFTFTLKLNRPPPRRKVVDNETSIEQFDPSVFKRFTCEIKKSDLQYDVENYPDEYKDN